MTQIRGIIFDLDGTLVDSRLDFEAMRREMGLPSGVPILEALEATPDGQTRDQMVSAMRAHELRGADQAVLFDGVREFLDHVCERSMFAGVLTRNSRESTDLTLARLNLAFATVVTREDAPPKPDPAGVKLIIERWGLSSMEVVVIGDYLYDLQAGRQAGLRTVLFAPGELPHFAHEADFILRDFRDAVSLLNFL